MKKKKLKNQNKKRKFRKVQNKHVKNKVKNHIIKKQSVPLEIKTKEINKREDVFHNQEHGSGKEQKLIEKYEVEVDNSKVTIEIKKTPLGIEYHLQVPKIDIATTTLLNEIRNELISVTTISMRELTDTKLLSRIKERFSKDARKLLIDKLPRTSKNTENFLVGKLMMDMLGLGNIEFLIADPNLEEIVITSAKEKIRVFSKKYGWLKTNMRVEKEEDIINYSNIIARRVGRQINILNPLLDAHLVTGDRVNAVLYPINTKGNTITIRKFARDPYTIIDLIKNKTCSLDIASLIWLAVEYEMNVIISGGTASGKTVFLNACMPFIPPNQRIISIEDTRELMLPKFLYWT
ncbi:MAG: ATPase, T2SS/T4P/T4SS family, partial [Candidatus Pacearchaeota archaeon]|nr:ATPase, T2SS/T4P/T4SS family [Candidatus Pacearchaeota archaeon]